MDAAIERVVENLTGSGVVSAASNRRAFRVAQEPLDLFRNYFAVYALEQAYCHFSPALISNLEQHWNAKNRKLYNEAFLDTPTQGTQSLVPLILPR